MRGIWIKLLSLSLVCIIILTGCRFNRQKLVSIEIWHHYDGAQKIALDKLVTEFNQTEGMGKGIVVEALNQGNLRDLKSKILNTGYNKSNERQLPDIFSAEVDMIEEIDQQGTVVDLENYIKKGEVKNYDDPYISEGYIGRRKQFKMFPVGKYTEVMMVNKTDWEKFAYDTGAHLKDLETWEGLAKVAKRYYEWTDNKTPGPDNGKAFFARDNMENYMVIGTKQLGQEIFNIDDNHGDININNQVMQILWENFYIPYVNGYYGPFDNFSSTDMKTGEILAYIGTSDQVSYFPESVTINGNQTHEIDALMLPVPNFGNRKPYALLRGTGMGVLKSDEAHERAAVEFLKWLVKPANNVAFSLGTGYLPIAQSQASTEAIEARLKRVGVSPVIEKMLPVAAKQVETYNLHIQESFYSSDAARDVLANSLISRAKVDRLKVLKLMDQGMTRQEAVATVATETNFHQWVVRLKMEIKGVVKEKNYSN